MLRSLVLLGCLVGSFAACSNDPAEPDPTAVATDYSLGSFESITLERTGCYGFCPTYQVTIHADGLVVYEGFEHVGVLGEHRGHVDEAGILELLALCSELDFFALAEEYRFIENDEGERLTITDQPSRFTTLRLGRREHQVENYFGGPDLLRALEDRLDELSGAAEWKKRAE